MKEEFDLAVGSRSCQSGSMQQEQKTNLIYDLLFWLKPFDYLALLGLYELQLVIKTNELLKREARILVEANWTIWGYRIGRNWKVVSHSNWLLRLQNPITQVI